MLAAVAAGIVLTLCAAQGWGGDALLTLLPAMLLGCLLCARMYPGERMLVTAHRGRSKGWARAVSSPRPRRLPLIAAARGGLLIASSLAVRPPPRLSRAS